MSNSRAERRRAERREKGEYPKTFDETNPAWIPIADCAKGILTEDDVRRGRYYFPPFTALSASGIEQCATLLGVHGRAERAKAVGVIHKRIQERWPS